MKLNMGMARQLAEKLATKREAEVRRGEEFLEMHNSYILRDILAYMGLHDIPSQCDVNITPFDTNLLDINISDLDRYALEYLVGILSKSEKHGSLKGSFSMSNDSSHSAEVEVNAVDSFEKYDTDEHLELSELVDIAGTSKLEVENVKLKAELASAIALICFIGPEIEFESLDDSKVDTFLKNAAEKTAEALHLKDEYGKRLQSMLKVKQTQCESYEKCIQELEQRLSDQYMQGRRLPVDTTGSKFSLSAVKAGDSKSEISGDAKAHMPCVSSEPMDEVSCASNSLHLKLGLFSKQLGKAFEGLDENMIDSPSMLNAQLDSSMLLPRDEVCAVDKDGKDIMVADVGMALATSCTAESMSQPLNNLPAETAAEQGLNSKASSDLMLELHNALVDKSNQLNETKTKLKALVILCFFRRGGWIF